MPHHHDHALAELAAHLELAEVEVALAELQADLDAGLIPQGARRGRNPAERAARVDFSRIAGDVDTIAAQVARDLARARAGAIDVLTEWLAEGIDAGGRDELIHRCRALLDPSMGRELDEVLSFVTGDTAALVEPQLRDAVLRGGLSVIDEAIAQGRPVPDLFDAVLTDQAAGEARRQAERLASTPLRDLMRAMGEHYYTLPAFDLDPDDLVDRLRQHARQLSDRPLDDLARQAVHRGYGMGRADTGDALAAAAGRPPAGPDDVDVDGRTIARIYASELLDSNTCGPCSLVDGREYPSMEAARVDYPAGQYVACEGGARCRGTLVIVWSTEGEARGPGTPPPAPPPPAPDVDPGPELPPGLDDGPPVDRPLRLDLDGPAPPMPGHLQFDRATIDPGLADVYEDAIRRLAADYPAIAARLGYVGTTAGAKRFVADRGVRLRSGGSPYAFASDVARAGGRTIPGTIGVNASGWWSKAKARRFVESLANDGDFHPEGTRNPLGVVVHEFGHHLFYAIKRDPDLAPRWSAAVDRRIADELGIGDRNTAEGARAFYAATRAISRYATKNADERFAEAFANAKLADDDQVAPLARIMVEEADRLLRGVTPGATP